MPYYVDVSRGPSTSLDKYPPSFGASLSNAFDSSLKENATALIFDAGALRQANALGKPRLERSVAEQRVKESGFKIAVPDDGYTEEALDILIDRQKQQAAVRSIQDRTPWSWIGSPVRGAASLLAGVVDPLNVASAFVPVVREQRIASMLARAGGSAVARAGVRAGVGGIEGAAGAVMLEPLVYGMHSQLQDDYGMADSLVNLGFGAILGGGLHMGAGAVADVWRPKGLNIAPADVPDVATVPRFEPVPVEPTSAAALIRSASPEVREVALRAAVADMAQGRVPEVDAVLRVDRKPTETPEFKAWFGESRVVDAEGAPLVVYHGTTRNFNEFSELRLGEKGSPLSELGFFFAEDPALASSFTKGVKWLDDAEVAPRGANVMPVVLSMQNPMHVQASEIMKNTSGGGATALEWAESSEWVRRLKARAQKSGHDGVVIDPLPTEWKKELRGEFDRRQFVAFHPEQIKSAIGNSGRFDPNSASLTDPISAVRDAAARQQTAPSALADPEASRAADERLKEAPKANGLPEAQAELDKALGRIGVITEPETKAQTPPPTQALDAVKEWRTSGADLKTWLDAAKLPPEIHNLVVGLSEMRGEEQTRLLADYARTLDANPTARPEDIAADVVEASRSGRTITPEVKAAKEEMMAAEQRLAQAQARLEAMGITPEQAKNATEGMARFDEAITDAQNIGKALKALTTCETMT